MHAGVGRAGDLLMALADIKARIGVVVASVTGIGKVYTRMRLFKTEAEFAAAVSGGTVNIWMLAIDSSAGRDLVVNQNLTEYTDVICVHGYHGMSDAKDSTSAFEALAYAVRDAINNDRIPPSELAKLVNSARPPSMKFDYQEYGPTKVLCHHVAILLPVVIDKQPS
jgi:hypothetical protein